MVRFGKRAGSEGRRSQLWLETTESVASGAFCNGGQQMENRRPFPIGGKSRRTEFSTNVGKSYFYDFAARAAAFYRATRYPVNVSLRPAEPQPHPRR